MKGQSFSERLNCSGKTTQRAAWIMGKGAGLQGKAAGLEWALQDGFRRHQWQDLQSPTSSVFLELSTCTASSNHDPQSVKSPPYMSKAPICLMSCIHMGRSC